MEKAYSYKHNPIVRRILLAMLAPTILMNLTTAIGSMADAVIIGHYLDDLSLSVVTYATPLYMIINTFSALFAVGGCIAMSIDSGKGAKETAHRAFSLSIELLAAVGLLFLLAGVFFSGPITHWLGAGAEVYESTRQYSQIVLMGAPIFALNIGLAFFVRNDGRPTLSMVGMFSSIAVDIIFNFVFVGFMGLGVAGAAYSTVLGQVVSVLVIATHFFSKKNTLRFRFTLDKTLGRIIKNGTSSALHFVYQFVTVLIINHFLASMAGPGGVVIYTVVFNLSTVSLSVFEGISQTIQPMVSNYYGEKSFRNIRETLRLALLAVVLICGTVTAALEIFPQAVPGLFGIDDPALVADSAVAVRIFSTSMIIMTINVVIGYYLQSTEQNAMAAGIISLRCFVLFLGATLVLGKCFGMNGVWAAYTTAEVLTFLIILIMGKVKQKKWEKKGTPVDFLLLPREAEGQNACWTCDCGKENLEAYSLRVEQELAARQGVSPGLRESTAAYLAVLQECAGAKKGRYVEVELNGAQGKVIIRDNLDHSAAAEKLQAAAKGRSADYGPVLGWNRMCME